MHRIQGPPRTNGLRSRAAEITGRLFDAGVLTCTAQGDVVRFLPPYILTPEDLAEGLSRLEHVLTDLPTDPS